MWFFLLLTATAGADERSVSLEQYQQRRLIREPIVVTTGGPNYDPQTDTYTDTTAFSSSWQVIDGGGDVYSTERFAATVGDAETLQMIQRRRRIFTTSFYVFGGAGLAMATTGWVLSSSADPTDPDPPGRPLIWTGLLVGGAGIAIPGVVYRQRRDVPQSYTPREAEQWINGHNTALRQDLGLSEADILHLETRAPTIRPLIGPGYLVFTGTF